MQSQIQSAKKKEEEKIAQEIELAASAGLSAVNEELTQEELVERNRLVTLERIARVCCLSPVACFPFMA